MLKKKITTKAVSVAIISLLLITMHNQPPKEPLIPDTSPVSASLELGRDNTPPTENKAVVAEREKQVYDFDQILQDEVSVPIPLVKVALEDLPELDYANSYSDFMGLMLMIKE